MRRLTLYFFISLITLISGLVAVRVFRPFIPHQTNELPSNGKESSKCFTTNELLFHPPAPGDPIKIVNVQLIDWPAECTFEVKIENITEKPVRYFQYNPSPSLLPGRAFNGQINGLLKPGEAGSFFILNRVLEQEFSNEEQKEKGLLTKELELEIIRVDFADGTSWKR